MARNKIRVAHSKFQVPTAVQGFLLLCLAVLLALSSFSFIDGEPSKNWLGLFGHITSWGFQYLFGLTSLLIPVYIGWYGTMLLLNKPILHPRWKMAWFCLALFSLSVLFSMVAQAKPMLASYFGRWVYSEFYPKGAIFAPEGLRHYLGGVPVHHLYFDTNQFSLYRIFGGVGTFLIFFCTFVVSGVLLTNVRLSPLMKKMKESIKKLQEHKPRLERLKAAISRPKIIERPFAGIELEPPPPMVANPDPIPQEKRETTAPVSKSAPTGKLSHYTLPPSSLLTHVKQIDPSTLKNDLRRQAEVLEETFASFGIEAKVGEIHCGPTITSFEVHPAVGVKVQKIKALENDIALNMQAKSIRIIAPIPGKAAVGIEVPNFHPQEVGFRELLENYKRAGKKCHIPLLLGKVVNGDDVWTDLTKMPHLIIAGATGSGKSVCINTIVMSILMNNSPDEIKLVIVDPKKVELTGYSRLPHMLAPVITEPGEACAGLGWLVKEMEKRYEIFRILGTRNIHGFNARKINKELEESFEYEIPKKMPYIVVIIDELADLMMVSSSDIETPIARIAQMARAVGIHLILATQRPSREVITGLIKANFPTRIAFKVANRVNSQIIIDENGAESLLGNGDMLFMPPGSSNLVRTQGAFIRDEDINNVIDFICDQAPTDYLIPSFNALLRQDNSSPDGEGNDPLYREAKALVFETGNASTTFLQRKLKIGYARAASLMDELEAMGIIGPGEGAKPRKIFYPSQSKDDR
ncbi:MAG: DNA translocase FtsK [Chlamydiae bacterium]|nr:DNA translocase FtsK [Chlamydiota bacterium]